MQTQESAVLKKTKTFLARFQQFEQMEREGTDPVHLTALYDRWISDASSYFQQNGFTHEARALQEITTRIEEDWGVVEVQAAQLKSRRDEIKAMMNVLIENLEQSAARMKFETSVRI